MNELWMWGEEGCPAVEEGEVEEGGLPCCGGGCGWVLGLGGC